MQGIDVLEDVRGLVGDEEDVEVFEGLVDEADVGGFDGGVLGVGGDELGEGGEEGFDARARHVAELAGEDGWGCIPWLDSEDIGWRIVTTYVYRLWCISRLRERPGRGKRTKFRGSVDREIWGSAHHFDKSDARYAEGIQITEIPGGVGRGQRRERR